MAIAVYAGKTFQVSSRNVYTFDKLTYSGGLNVENQEVDGKKSSTYIKSIDLCNMNFTIKLDTSLGINVREELESWEKIKNNKIPYIFSLGGKPVGYNKWLLINTEWSNLNIDGNGSILSAAIKLSFQEYVRRGSSTSVSTGEDIDIDMLTGNKELDKRYNPNYEESTFIGPKLMNEFEESNSSQTILPENLYVK